MELSSKSDRILMPGSGWSNGDISPQLYPITQAGKLQSFGSQRRWIGLQSGWTRVGDGEGKPEVNARHSSSAGTGEALVTNDEEEARTVRCLIAQLCEKFYALGWAPGTSGGISIRVPCGISNGETAKDWRVFVTPSGIQKEDMIGDDVFEMDMEGNVVILPKTPGLRPSACTPLWYVVFKNRPTARCAIHTHSMQAVQVTLLDENSCCLRLTCLEMLKGVGHHAYDDILEIPIIDNRPTEDLLADQMEEAITKYPLSNAVLVRRHGLFVWGDSWEQAKTQCESFDYLFECAVRMKQMGIDPMVTPKPENINSKKRKLESSFNGVSSTDNSADVASNVTPLFPRDNQRFKAVVLDIEGCTTSISFVTDVMFPYVRVHLASYCAKLKEDNPQCYMDYVDSLKKEVLVAMEQNEEENKGLFDATNTIEPLVIYLMDRDVKSAALKDLQGKMWKTGFDSGEIKGHVYADTTAMLKWMKDHGGVPVYIYSSGSINAQKLLFGNSVNGNLLPNIAGHFDITTAGPKKEADSYRKIASSLNLDVTELVFVSDAEAELYAAQKAGIGAPIMSIRPGNAPLTNGGKEDFYAIHTLLQLCG